MAVFRPASVLALLVAVCLASEDARALDWASGKLTLARYTQAFTRTSKDGDPLQSSGSLWLSLGPKLPEPFFFKAEVLGTVFYDSIDRRGDWDADADVKELWAGIDRSGFEFRAGQLLVPWGKTDGVNPTDYLTGRDLNYLSRDDAFTRLGAPGVFAAFTPNGGDSPFQFTGVWNFSYAQSRLLIPPEAVPAGLPVVTKASNPEIGSDHFEFAGKIAYLGWSWDASISAFHGRSHFPQFVYENGVASPAFVKEEAIGADFSRTFDGAVLRFETAYFFMYDGARGLEDMALTQPDHWDFVAGFERPFGTGFRALVQALYRYYPVLPDSQAYVGPDPVTTAIARGVARANALLVNYQEKSRLGATLMVSYESPEGDFEASVNVIGNFVGGDYRLSPELGYRVFPNAKVYLGANYYGGPDDRPIGALKNYSTVFVEGQYAF